MLCRAESAGSSQRRGVKYRAHLFSPVSLIHSAHLADTCEAGARKVYCHSSHSRKAPGYHRINAGELLKRSCGRAGVRAFGRVRVIGARETLRRQPGLPRTEKPRSRAGYHLQVHDLERGS